MTEEAGEMKLTRSRRRRKGAVMTADEYQALIRAYVDQARSDLSIAERLAVEARRRFGAEIEVPAETE